MCCMHKRIQYAVGQGGFHSGEIYTGHTELRYVVDCGAMTKYQASRIKCINEYICENGAHTTIDLLFITHAHADHLNGIDQLLDPESGMRVHTIVMPLLNVTERLICYAKTILEDQSAASNAFYRSFIENPEGALARFEPTQILRVRSSAPEGGAPFSQEDEVPFDRDGNNLNPDQSTQNNTDTVWRTVGKGASSSISSDSSGTKDISDSIGFLHSEKSHPIWILAPYVDPSVQSELNAFLTQLATQLKQTVSALQENLKNTEFVKKLISDKTSELKNAYKSLEKDLNITSLTIYSGPIACSKKNGMDCIIRTDAKINKWLWRHNYSPFHPDKKCGWLGTGDAALKDQTRRQNFFKHYGPLLQLVHTFTLPHHGSEGNFDASLLTKIRPVLCVAAADRIGKWRHPGSTVVQSVGSAGAMLSVVTSNEDSQLEESCFLHFS